MANRKLLKVGTDVLTINNQLVSVTEDYPFWKVNSNLIEQYYNALIPDLRPKYDINDFNTPIDLGSATGTAASMILAPNGSIYSCPSSAPSIVKITPNPNNHLTPTIEYIGNFGTGTFKWSSVHLVGDYLIFVPGSSTFIMVLDTRNDSIQQFGNFLGTTKWGAADFADDGRLFCPPYSSGDWLIINVSDPTNITTTLHPGLASQNLKSGCVNGGNGFIYTLSASNSGTYQHTKINTSTLVEITFTTGDNAPRRAIYPSKPFNFNGTLFYHGFNGLYSINTSNDAISYLSIPVNAAQFNTPCMGADGWLYFTHIGSNWPNFRLNPLNFSTEITSSFLAANGGTAMALANDGRMYGVNVAASPRILMRNTPTPEPMVDNRLLSRYTNSK